MTTTAISTWPEASYALSLTKPGTWPVQRQAMELFCAHAWAQGVMAGPLVCSHRDLASHLYRSAETGVGSAGRLFRELVARGVLREIGKGVGRSESEWDVAHWTGWKVPWRIRPASVLDRMTAFVAGEIRAQSPISARVLVRALAKSARQFSADLDHLARESMESRANDSTLIADSQVRALRFARYGATDAVLPVRDEIPLSVSERVDRSTPPPAPDLVQALTDGCRIKWLATSFHPTLLALEALAGSRRAQLVALARSPFGPTKISERLAWVRLQLEAPIPLSSTRPTDRAEQLRRDLEIAEKIGDDESVQSLKQQLATMDA